MERHVAGLRGPRTVVLPDRLFQTIASTETSQGVIALVRPPEWSIDQLFRGQSLVVVLDGLQDPGNAGAIVRAAEAFGATGRAVRQRARSARSIRRRCGPRRVRCSAFPLLPASMRRWRARRCSSTAWISTPRCRSRARNSMAGDVDFSRCAIVIGSEGRGVSQELHGDRGGRGDSHRRASNR